MSYMLFASRTALLATLALAGLGACKSVKGTFSATPTAVITKRLPPLEITADPGPLAMNDGALPEDPLRMFKAELQRNVVEPTDTATYGYARLVVTKVHTTRTGRSLQAAQVLTMLVPSVFGAPLEWYKTDIQAEVQLMNASGELLGTYTGKGTSNVKVAMYHGYSQTEAPRLADVLALREALGQIRPQLDTAATRLRPLLMAGGQVNNPTLPTSSR
ncbi:hypothetical protein GO988_12290 [Hymenobacter sp. HMF4947]|uniref:DUF4136 domain-containing protein n=1 Tax=Hymenobacter ginkgonis TaxID=2682976 RepID=A0A7K1TFC9_9BACT|nr:hypothetical protein [Hymenobacter ginkgonis]MVN77106.1 hypothetical protein [Hymenobacter ginkgonis]